VRGREEARLRRVWAVAVVCAGSITQLAAQSIRSMSFDGANGTNPQGALVQATDGNFYGTTQYGGANGFGTVFRLTPAGVLTTMQSFGTSAGFAPEAGLIVGANGDLYGTTSNDAGGGSAFEMTLSGVLTTLSDQVESLPIAPLLQGTDGNFYGTTSLGPGFFGAVFQVTPSGVLTYLHVFDESDGGHPAAGLVEGPDGNYYGSTEFYGANDLGCGTFGCGTLFRITPAGVLTTLVNFEFPQGIHPIGSLYMDITGTIYGTDAYGGTSTNCKNYPNGAGCGTIFTLAADGDFTRLYSFDGTDGFGPTGPLLLASDGNFYGTTLFGGAHGYGTIFKISPTGNLTTLYSFNFSDGSQPGPLMQATDGSFWGLSSKGGASRNGVAFTISAGLPAFIKTVPTAAAAGTQVQILGTNLSAASQVTFNGIAAPFTVISASLITSPVPSGATTGKVEVTTPSGNLSNIGLFQVLP
jgi:uncharacterized repeat protein (TIGR03803 family)